MSVAPADIKSIFGQAMEIESPEERAAFLDRECGGNAKLRADVDELLLALDRAGQFMERRNATIDFAPITEKPGTMIGPYKLKEQIGEGGFGLVFVAEQQEPVKRKVALKVIKPGMDTREVMARFTAERQALAMMDHPNIARVLDAGATDSGRPYFVMELVRGIPITEYCDQNQLSPRDRLDLFVTVCQAVQHAHQKGIIHRDIKPSNVLVTSHDGKPVAKVIDFGVAKAINQQLTERSIYTNFAQMIGTPLYMSPEQAEMSGLDIDTRSDIYSLGVLLYELLTGTTPLEKKQLCEAAYDEIRRLIREEEPPKPSTRLSTSESIVSIAAQRHTEPAKLSKLMRGDLDWITMKALEKDRTRRYETANGLARDIQRYLSDEPVEACPPSASYRLRKFARKNRAALATASLFAFTLVLFSALCIWFAIDSLNAQHRATVMQVLAEQERDRANAEATKASQAAEAEKKAKEAAQAREAETKAVIDFIEKDIIIAAGREDQRELPFRKAIEAVMPSLGTSFRDQPAVEAKLRFTLGWSYFFGNDFEKSAEQLRMSRELYSKCRGPIHPDTLLSTGSLAICYDALGRESEALRLREEALAGIKAVPGPVSPEMAEDVIGLTMYEGNRRPFDVNLQEDALSYFSERLGRDHPTTLTYMGRLAFNYELLDRHADALKLYEEALARRKVALGPDATDTLQSQMHVAVSLNKLGRGTEAVPVIDDFVRRAEGRTVKPGPIPTLIVLRLRHFEKAKDAAGCRTTAEMWEKLDRRDAGSLYDAARYRAVASTVQATAAGAARLAGEDADKAMEWLRKAVAAGYKDVAHMKKDTDLDPLREREDFKKMIAELEAKVATPKPAEEKKP